MCSTRSLCDRKVQFMNFLFFFIFSGSFVIEYNKMCICLIGNMLRVIINWAGCTGDQEVLVGSELDSVTDYEALIFTVCNWCVADKC